MEKLLSFILLFVSINLFSQNSSCNFSDGNYHYSLSIIIDNEPSINFDKTDFISYLETNSNASTVDIQFMNENIIDVFRSYPNATTETLQRVFYITAINDSLETFLSMYVDSISNVTIYCDCLFTSGFYEYYSRLVIDDIPPTDFDKTDYIQHLEQNSSIATEDITFLNSVIVEVYRTFPASSQENLQRGLTIVSNSDLLVPFLKDYSQAIEFIELDCSESGLSINDINLENSITIFPNPIVDDFTISIGEEQTIKKLIVFDVTGKTIITKKIDGLNYIEMNNSNLESGIYFLKFSNGTNSAVKKVIVR